LAREWEFYTAAGGGDPVNKELGKIKLSPWEAGRLDEAMDRRADGLGRVGVDFKYLRDGVSECLVDGHNRTFRLFYADLEGRSVLLALHFVSKKKQNDRSALALAVRRLKDWRRRNPT
jgi:phage-related protein